MSVKTVQCCQCGSPLQLPESGAELGLLQCQHCSALLEVQDLEHGSVTRLRADLQAVQAATAEHAEVLRIIQLERRIAEYDQRFRDRWGKTAETTADQAARMIGPVMIFFGGLAVTSILILPFWEGLGGFLAIGVVTIGIGMHNRVYLEDRVEYEARRNKLLSQLISRDERMH